MQTLWKFAQSLVHDGLHDSTVDHKVTNLSCTRCRLEDWAIAWDAALRGARLSRPPELTKAEIYVIEAVLGVPFDKAQGQRPEERKITK